MDSKQDKGVDAGHGATGQNKPNGLSPGNQYSRRIFVKRTGLAIAALSSFKAINFIDPRVANAALVGITCDLLGHSVACDPTDLKVTLVDCDKGAAQTNVDCCRVTPQTQMVDCDPSSTNMAEPVDCNTATAKAD